MADVHAALAYYFDHQAEISYSIQADQLFVAAQRQQTPSLLQAKLRHVSDGYMTATSIERLFMMTATPATLPDAIRPDLERAVQILKSVGCSAIFVFGSATEGTFKHTSDIDLAVRGCPPPAFFPVFGQLMLELEHPVDLIDLDDHSLFGQHLQQNGTLVQIG